MNKPKHKTPRPKQLIDQYGNIHYSADELARGGQGVVFRTKDADLAIKQPLDASGNPDGNIDLRDRFQHIRLLPLPHRIPISLPLAILRDEPGYVMRLLNDMSPFSNFELDGKTRGKLATQELPEWLNQMPNEDFALQLLHYANTGSTARRLFALSKCAATLARLHCSGIVYGDISSNNVFVGSESSKEVWLIDADNLCFETIKGVHAVYTPHYGAPEIVQGRDKSRPRTDCWAFAVMAFRSLTLCHPFIGKKVTDGDSDQGGWDADPIADGVPADLDEQAYAGYLPFIDDKDDDCNAAQSGLPRELVATSMLRRLFQETFGPGRTQPQRRPSMLFWAIEFARASDLSLNCPECKMSYFADDYTKCPYCDTSRPAFAYAKTENWKVLIPDGVSEFALPHCLFNPYSPEHYDETTYESVINFTKQTAKPVRGTRPFPDNLEFTFVEATK